MKTCLDEYYVNYSTNIPGQTKNWARSFSELSRRNTLVSTISIRFDQVLVLKTWKHAPNHLFTLILMDINIYLLRVFLWSYCYHSSIIEICQPIYNGALGDLYWWETQNHALISPNTMNAVGDSCDAEENKVMQF